MGPEERVGEAVWRGVVARAGAGEGLDVGSPVRAGESLEVGGPVVADGHGDEGEDQEKQKKNVDEILRAVGIRV